jgi:lipoprotein-anchoring transpeptidase ErfK/SrfK
MGVFSVIQKDRWHRSNIYDNAPMFYMQRITWSGVAMHQGHVPGVPASHGCIRRRRLSPSSCGASRSSAPA